MLKRSTPIGSPVQHHPVDMFNDISWVSGTLRTNGNPNNYINQDGLIYLVLEQAHVVPWTFSGLPTSSPERVVTTVKRIQGMIFTGEDAIGQFRRPPRLGMMIITTPMAVVRGQVPLLSEAKMENFLEFWRGVFFPVLDASLYFIAEGQGELPEEAPIVYLNRDYVITYVEG